MGRAAILLGLAVLATACSGPERPDAGAAPAAPGLRRVSVFFSRGDSCDVRAFPRDVADGDSVAVVRRALEALIAGPTSQEAAGGWRSAFPDTLEILRHRMRVVAVGEDPPHEGRTVSIRSVAPAGPGELRVDFSRELEAHGGGVTRVCAIVRQVQETVRQFPPWRSVLISIEGRTEGILQP